MEGSPDTVARDLVTEEPGQQAPPVREAHAPTDFDERPELFVGAAFAGGFLLAKLIGRLRG